MYLGPWLAEKVRINVLYDFNKHRQSNLSTAENCLGGMVDCLWDSKLHLYYTTRKKSWELNWILKSAI